MFDKPEIEFSPEEEQIRANLYNQLIEFLENDVLNVTSAGYFAKAMIAIIKRRGFDVRFRINLGLGEDCG
jgi:serine/threonine-protein phosphatase 6 regulatory subunit 3